MKPCFCMSGSLKENVPAAFNDAVSADKFLFLFLSDDEPQLSVTWCPRIAKKSLRVQVLHKEGHRILILMTGGQWQLEPADLSISKYTRIENEYWKFMT